MEHIESFKIKVRSIKEENHRGFEIIEGSRDWDSETMTNTTPSQRKKMGRFLSMVAISTSGLTEKIIQVNIKSKKKWSVWIEAEVVEGAAKYADIFNERLYYSAVSARGRFRNFSKNLVHYNEFRKKFM